jgi:glycosyltransferase involved in cell wall biosynthesis
VKVGLVIYGSLQTVSGGYLYDRKLVERLAAEGDEVEIISLPWRDYGRHLADNLSRDLPRRLARARCDILLQDELNHPSLVLVNRRLRGRLGGPIVAIVHHPRCREARPGWQNALYRQVERRYLATVDGFIFNSRTTRREVEGLGGGGRPAVVATPAGDRLGAAVTPAEVATRARRPGPLEIVFVGNVIPRKGLHTLVEALARLDGDWRLSVVGSLTVDGVYAGRIERRIAALGLGERARLLGPLPDAALADRLARGQVLAVPSLYEGYGIVYIEAMGFGLPALATTAGAAGEIVTDGRDGFLIPPGDAAALTDRLGRLMRDRALLAEMGVAALRRYAAQPSWADTTGAIRRFLVEMSRGAASSR